MTSHPPSTIRRRFGIRKWLAIVLFVLVVLVVLRYGQFPQESRITYANFVKINDGMSQQEVEAILGCPPGNYTFIRDWGGDPYADPRLGWDAACLGEFKRWRGLDGTVWIIVGSGVVREKAFVRSIWEP